MRVRGDGNLSGGRRALRASTSRPVAGAKGGRLVGFGLLGPSRNDKIYPFGGSNPLRSAGPPHPSWRVQAGLVGRVLVALSGRRC